jgi:hypothetical protein
MAIMTIHSLHLFSIGEQLLVKLAEVFPMMSN